MNNEIKEILDKFDKVLENYELDKKFGQMSVDSICHLFPSEMVAIKDYITNLQKENDKLKKLEYKFFYCSEDEESFTLEDYLELGNKVYDLQQENERIKWDKEQLNSLVNSCQEEIRKLKEENKHIFANVNDDQLLRSNAMN